MGALALRLSAHLLAGLFQQRQVEGGTETGAAGEAGGLGALEELGATNAIGSVREAEGRNAMLREGSRVPEVNTWADRVNWVRVK